MLWLRTPSFAPQSSESSSAPHVSGTTGSSGAPRAGVHPISLLLGLAGFGVSLWALVESVKLGKGATDLGCDINNLVNCTKVIGSEYGKIAGIPLGAFGMSYFGVVIAAALLPKFAEMTPRWISTWRLPVAAIGAIVSLGLAYISYFRLEAVCAVCSTVHAISIVNFVVVLVSFLKSRSGPSSADSSAFLKFVSTALAFGVPPLVAGLIAPSLPLGGGDTATAAQGEQAPAVTGTAFPADLLRFSKSDFVGKGQDYRRGNDNAKVVLFMYSDFECPHCAHTSKEINKALSVVGEDKVLFVYRNYPLSNRCNSFVGSEGHKNACQLALAARCAGQQGKFWEYKEWIFAGIEMSPSEKDKAFAPEGLKEKAKSIGIDAGRFAECFDGQVEMPKIKDDIEVGNKLGLQGTPLLVLNGRKYTGAFTAEALVTAFQTALASAGP